METVVTSNGRIVIPSRIRRQLGIKDGTHILMDVDEQAKKVILTPVTREFVHSLRGKYRGRGLMRALISEKTQEGER
jgi:AbrB family looped-hinge helix DNA binding protein